MFRKIMKARIFNIFKRELNQNEKLIKNVKAYEQKEREKQDQIRTLKRNKSSRQKIEEI
jgi:ribosomal protein S19|tara:strand:+ start:343 stop:519 length:177 start_codon:yes stop_codon:yes gene_type:complete